MKKFNCGDSFILTGNSENQDSVSKFCTCGLRVRVCISYKEKNFEKTFPVLCKFWGKLCN